MSLKIFLLGQFKLQADQRPFELPSRPAQSLLAFLALNAGVSHRREKLSGLLWPDSTESNARGYLRQALWRIRKHFEAASLSWQAYLQISDIDVSFDAQSDFWLDARQFLRPVEELPLDELIAVVQLYQDELLPGFYDEWILAERDRLRTAYSHRMNLLLERLIRFGRWEEVLRWAEQWIKPDCSPEAAFRAMLTAYAVLGDQTLVSATYQRCIEALDRELGLDPSPRTRQLYEQILRGEMSLLSTPRAVAGPAGDQPPFLKAREEPPLERPLFVAREQELSQLESHLRQAEAAQGRVVFITGEAGSGKTALLHEFARRAQADQANLLVAGGNCNAQTGIGDPYLPFREILELLSGDVEARWAAGALSGQHARRLWQALPFTVEALLDASADLIGTFVAGAPLAARAAAYTPNDEFGTPIDGGSLERLKRLSDSSARTSSGQGPEQRDLFEQYVRVLQSLARRFLLVLVLDDLQWSDLGSINLLFHLGRHIDRSRILVLGAFRPEEVALGRDGERHPLEPLVNEFKRDYGDIVVNLSQAKGEAFVDAILDSEPNRLGNSFRAMLHRQTQGQPLFTIELLRGMQERGDLLRGPDGYWLEGPALDWHTLPARVEAVVGERIGRLDRSLQDILRVASVEGETFTAEVLAQVSGTEERALLGSLSGDLDRRHRLIRAQSIARVDGRLMSRYRFRHILFQKYLYNSMDEIEQVHLHESVGTALEALYGSQQGTMAVSVQLARHFQKARIIDKAIHYLQQAGDKAIHLSAFPEGIAHLNSALTMLAELPESPERLRKELALQLSKVIAMKGSIPEPEWEEVFNRARELCQRTGNKVQWCQVSCELSISCYVRAQHQKAYELGQEALDLALECENPLLTAICQWQMGYHLFAMGQFDAARGYLDQVLTFYDPQQHHQALVSLRGSDPGVGAMAYDACSLW
ncbi:MAG: AAA family ATPase, partial [Chloroflexota bacterium]